ncbi:MAG: DUF3592 domain-containing protein [Lachnospiraceae bacterium]|nr:DUF3592 domain-containing protein [Lachnospiraceae bacterium]
MPGNLWMRGTVLVILGLIADVAGLIVKIYSAYIRPYEGYSEAEVVDIISMERDRNAESRYRNRQVAVFQFFADGKLVKIVDREDAYPCPYELGQRVRLCYDPENPEKYVVLHGEKMRYRAIALNAVGAILILAGVLMFLAYAMRYTI